MENNAFAKRISEIIPVERVWENEPMSAHTTFRTGGPASYFILADNAGELGDIMALAAECDLPHFVIGRGSNLLVSDKGYPGAVIKLGGEFTGVEVDGCLLTAGAGAQLIGASMKAAAEEHSLTGLEFASGIPGSVGGAVYMNAGAYDGEISGVLIHADVLMPDGSIKRFLRDELQLSYRSSILKTGGGICLGALFELEKGDPQKISARINELSEKRRAKQPLEYASAGSTFKRPEGCFAGKLIMDAGLAGERVGGACVSEKHCGFIINDRGATSADIKQLMDLVRARVLKESGVTLEPEVCLIGEF